MRSLNISFMKNVMKIGGYYWKNPPDRNKLLKDWWEAYCFIADRIFYQGRKDELSTVIKRMAREVLEAKIDTKSKTGLTGLTITELANIKDTFSNSTRNGKKYKRKSDVRMLFGEFGENRVIDQGVLTLIHGLPDSNLVRYIYDEVNKGHIDDVYWELQSIHSIGHKIASFVLRDVVDLYYDKLGKVSSVRRIDGQKLLQPIDTWVEQVAKKAGIQFEKENHVLHKAQRIVESCRFISESRRKAIQFNQGAYLLGKKSIDILVPLLSKQLDSDTSRSIRGLL